jgi:hypothetical protein
MRDFTDETGMEPCYDASLSLASNVAAAMQILSSAVTQLASFKVWKSWTAAGPVG